MSEWETIELQLQCVTASQCATIITAIGFNTISDQAKSNGSSAFPSTRFFSQ